MDSDKSPSKDDPELVRRFIAGDRQAFDDLYRIHAPQVLAFLTARVTSIHAAEDLSQSVWVQVWKKRESFDGQHFRGWIFQIARNRMIDAGRTASARNEVSGIDDAAVVLSRDSDPSEIKAMEELRNRELNALRDCIKSVGGDFVDAVIRTQIDKESPADIAQNLGVKRATIDTRVSRGKEKLRECLEKKLK
ncbi:MAG: RNA polymerase sigma factor [Fuerstia sp.]|nr:RNA polymerase sigma factor [Fuerstiella sp.]